MHVRTCWNRKLLTVSLAPKSKRKRRCENNNNNIRRGGACLLLVNAFIDLANSCIWFHSSLQGVWTWFSACQHWRPIHIFPGLLHPHSTRNVHAYVTFHSRTSSVAQNNETSMKPTNDKLFHLLVDFIGRSLHLVECRNTWALAMREIIAANETKNRMEKLKQR